MPIHKNMRRSDLRLLFDSLDENHDGELELAEFAQYSGVSAPCTATPGGDLQQGPASSRAGAEMQAKPSTSSGADLGPLEAGDVDAARLLSAREDVRDTVGVITRHGAGADRTRVPAHSDGSVYRILSPLSSDYAGILHAEVVRVRDLAAGDAAVRAVGSSKLSDGKVCLSLCLVGGEVPESPTKTRVASFSAPRAASAQVEVNFRQTFTLEKKAGQTHLEIMLYYQVPTPLPCERVKVSGARQQDGKQDTWLCGTYTTSSSITPASVNRKPVFYKDGDTKFALWFDELGMPLCGPLWQSVYAVDMPTRVL